MYELTTIESMAYHHSMLTDRVRTKTFLRAILKTVKPGDVVLDLGSGTGLLAYFACMSGARRVYAVEEGPIIELARAVCRHNGFQDRVVFMNDWSTNVELPEPVDVIVTETIGNVGFEEGLLHWILDARERFLVEGGRIIPGSVELVVVPAEAEEDYGYVNSWTQGLHSLDFSPARSLAVNNMLWAELSAESCLSEPAPLVRVDVADATTADIGGELSFVARRDGLVHGIGAWFAAELAPGEHLSNGPPFRAPSWSQVLLPLEQPLPVREGDRLWVQIQTRYHAAHWQWQVRRAGVDGGPGNSAIGGQGAFWEAAWPRQETLSGALRAPDRMFFRDHMPARTEEAEADLFILGAMNGTTMVEEIARQVTARFPAQFNTLEGALDHMYDLLEMYCRWESSDSVDSSMQER
jgi:protein arginine N-methyltransferase 1